MNLNEDRIPILIGAGQFTQRDVDLTEAKDPLALLEEAARRAAADAGGDARLLAQVDSIAVVNILSWHYANPPAALASRLGAAPSRAVYTTIGGNSPQWLVNEAAAQIAAGQSRLALVGGAEAVYSVYRARRAHAHLPWSADGEGHTVTVGSTRPGSNDHETAHGLNLPVAVYPLFENALRASYGWSLETHRARLGELCSRMSAVAAQNPNAWFREQRGAAEIATPSKQNRMIGFPYPKYMNAVLDVDQAAAVLVASVGMARRLGVPPSRWVYLWGSADLDEIWNVSERVNFNSSPAIAAAGQQALATAGVGVDDIDFFDFYSCFPCAVQIGRDMFGVAADDPRPLTVTGGLAYHGGPGNNYVTHAIATMMDRLRARPGTKGLVTGVGWFLTKHSVGIYGAEPPPRPWAPAERAAAQARIDAAPRPELVEAPSGAGVVETYTVLHDRDGVPMRGIVVGRLEDGRRFIANTPFDPELLGSFVAREGIGRPGVVRSDGGSNTFVPR